MAKKFTARERFKAVFEHDTGGLDRLPMLSLGTPSQGLFFQEWEKTIATEDLPDFKDYSMAGRGYRYYKGKALYPFGHGLSYTKFSYGGLHVAVNADRSLTVRLDITNTGEWDGDEVVQIYALPPASSRPREIHALCGFHRLHLAEGQTKKAVISVPAVALRRWSEKESRYVIHSGEWTIQAAASSTDIRQTATVKIP